MRFALAALRFYSIVRCIGFWQVKWFRALGAVVARLVYTE
jgi:hypothetical protein